jgi:hypothetical protein
MIPWARSIARRLFSRLANRLVTESSPRNAQKIRVAQQKSVSFSFFLQVQVVLFFIFFTCRWRVAIRPKCVSFPVAPSR